MRLNNGVQPMSANNAMQDRVWVCRMAVRIFSAHQNYLRIGCSRWRRFISPEQKSPGSRWPCGAQMYRHPTVILQVVVHPRFRRLLCDRLDRTRRLGIELVGSGRADLQEYFSAPSCWECFCPGGLSPGGKAALAVLILDGDGGTDNLIPDLEPLSRQSFPADAPL